MVLFLQSSFSNETSPSKIFAILSVMTGSTQSSGQLFVCFWILETWVWLLLGVSIEFTAAGRLLVDGWSRSGATVLNKWPFDFQWNGVCLLVLGFRFRLENFLCCTMNVCCKLRHARLYNIQMFLTPPYRRPCCKGEDDGREECDSEWGCYWT